MVRLQPIKEQVNNFEIELSQFHYGSITTYLFIHKREFIEKSQFHYGSITTIRCRCIANCIKDVSIPLWFDYNTKNFEGESLAKIVSIPLWFDYNTKNFEGESLAKIVSIPLWFDYN